MTANADQVTDLYATILDRPPETAGLNFWTQELDDGFSLQQVRDGFAYSPEATYDIETVAAAANAYLTDAQISGYEDQLAGGSSFAQVQASLDDDHVVALYQDILGRTPDAAGLSYWQGQLAQGASIQDVQNGIAYSQEATDRVQALAATRSIPLSGIEVISYETLLAVGQSFGQMESALVANNFIYNNNPPGQALPMTFVSGVVTDETAPIDGSVQPFAALHLFEDAAGTSGRFDVYVAPSSYGTSGGLPPPGTIVSAPPDASFTGITRVQAQDLLNKLTLHLDPNGDGVTIGVTIYDGYIFPDDVYTNISAAAGSPASGLNYIYGSSNLLNAAPVNLLSGSEASDLFVLGSGYDTIVNFDPGHDILQLNTPGISSFADVQANISSVGPGTFIHLAPNSAVNLIGVSPGSLRSQNFSFV